jgi:Mlc titration factor MtfA (ptsG expression regulator)
MTFDPPTGTWPMLALATAGLTGVAALASQTWRRERRRSRLRASPFPPAWRRILRRRVPLAARLPADLQLRLKGHIQVFLAEKPFIGCEGQAITDEVRVTIAAQACLLLLGEPRAPVYPQLRQVLVYPGAFAVEREQALGGGLVRQQRVTMSGESWAHGQVVLSWPDVLAGAADPADGRNVALHEFAHQVDQDKGHADGQPWRPGKRRRRAWAQAMGAGLHRLRTQPSEVIDPYGASDPAEYFACVTEAFFERPQALAAEEPAVYRELSGLYGVAPAAW